MINKDILTRKRLIELGFKESGKDDSGQIIFRIKPPKSIIYGFYPFEIEVVLRPEYDRSNPNCGILSIHSPKTETHGIPPNLLKKENWSKEDIKRAEKYTITLEEWTQPIAWYIIEENRLNELYLGLTGMLLEQTKLLDT